jgi:hypothetical protein
MLVRLVCLRPLLFCSVAFDASKQKRVVHMVWILLAWLVECGRFREYHIWIIRKSTTGVGSGKILKTSHASSLSDVFILGNPDYYPNIREIFHIGVVFIHYISIYFFYLIWQCKRQNRTRRTGDHWRVPIPCDDDIPNTLLLL